MKHQCSNEGVNNNAVEDVGDPTGNIFSARRSEVVSSVLCDPCRLAHVAQVELN